MCQVWLRSHGGDETGNRHFKVTASASAGGFCRRLFPTALFRHLPPHAEGAVLVTGSKSPSTPEPLPLSNAPTVVEKCSVEDQSPPLAQVPRPT
jgi:hypothetical protein